MTITRFLRRAAVAGLAVAAAAGVVLLPRPTTAADAPKKDEPAAKPLAPMQEQAERIKVIEKVRPAVAAVCFFGGKVCGSGVVISEDGYCLTNFHVVQPTGAVLACGLANGELYDSVLVGQDKIGDVALVKLLPKKDGDKFPFVELGDSDQVEAGDWSLAMGNPFGLALDFTPTVTYGLVSGVRRYQPPEGKGTLEYTDCIQFDTSINPGNSGGPLFNMKGQLIGINGRGSFEKRGRVNSGVGYAISINQIKNFLGHMKAGIDTDHATLGATIATSGEESGDTLSKMAVTNILEESDAYRRGLKPEDTIVTFADREITSTNQYKNVLGIFPSGWRLPLKYRTGTSTKTSLVRLMANMDKELEKPEQPGQPGPGPKPGPQPQPQPGGGGAGKSPAAKMVEMKKGYANYYFNKVETDRLLAAFKKKHGDGTAFAGTWSLAGDIKLADGRTGEIKLAWNEDKDGTEIVYTRGTSDEKLKPLTPDAEPDRFQPQGSGGLLAALYQYKLMVSKLNGAGGFKENTGNSPGFVHGGVEPVYPATDLKLPDDAKKARVDCEVIRTSVGSYSAKFFFSTKPGEEGTLIGMESAVKTDEDPCEVYFSEFKKDEASGLLMPHKMSVRWGDKVYAALTVKAYTLGKK